MKKFGLILLVSMTAIWGANVFALRAAPIIPGHCPQTYNAVCGIVAGKPTFYGNSCAARTVGARIVDNRLCNRPNSGTSCASVRCPSGTQCLEAVTGSGFSGARCVPKLGSSGGGVVCTTQYDPVCAKGRSGSLRTFSNSCSANFAGARVAYKGKCKSDNGGQTGICTKEVSPVCGTLSNGRKRTFTNRCQAEKARVSVIVDGRCGTNNGGATQKEPRVCRVLKAAVRVAASDANQPDLASRIKSMYQESCEQGR